MTNVTAFSHRVACGLSRLVLLSSLMACGTSPGGLDPELGATTATASTTTAPNASTAPSSSSASAAGSGSAGAAGSSSRAQQTAAGSGMKSSAAAGGAATSAQPAAAGSSAAGASTAGAPAATAAMGGAGAAGSSTTAAAMVGAAGASAGAAGALGAATSAGAAGAAGSDLTAAAKGFAELFLDAPCDSATRAPLEDGATCNHPPMTQHIEKPVMFGGEAGKKYTVTLRVRGIWEPTNIMGGMRPYEKQPFTVGGMVAGGSGSSSDSINYQQYYIEIAEPKQTYWLNDYQYVAHDIHKQDYEAAITIAGGSSAKVVMNDGNEGEIANFPKEMFSDVPPYDKMPSLGQSLRLDVVKVEAAP